MLRDLIEIENPIDNEDLSNRNVFISHAKPAVELLEDLNDESFENFVLEWAFGYNKKKYPGGVFKVAGPGDKGRDVVCFMTDPKLPNANWDNYQCKYYKDKLSPSNIWEEIGKIIYYSFKKEYPAVPPHNRIIP